MVHRPGRRPPCPQAEFHFDVFDIASNREIDNLFVEGVTNYVDGLDRLEIDQRRNQEAVNRRIVFSPTVQAVRQNADAFIPGWWISFGNFHQAFYRRDQRFRGNGSIGQKVSDMRNSTRTDQAEDIGKLDVDPVVVRTHPQQLE